MLSYHSFKNFYANDNSREKILKTYGIDLSYRKAPYTTFKASLYTFFGCRIAYICMLLNVSANSVTQCYILLGPLLLFLFALDNPIFLFLGILISYLKGCLDWADGPIARFTSTCSARGKWLDEFGAIINYDCLVAGCFIVLFNLTMQNLYIWLLLVYYASSQFTLLSYMLKLGGNSSHTHVDKTNPTTHTEFQATLKFSRRVFLGLFDSRARGNDTILLFVILAFYFDMLIPLQLSLFFILGRKCLISYFNLYTTPSILTAR